MSAHNCSEATLFYGCALFNACATVTASVGWLFKGGAPVLSPSPRIHRHTALPPPRPRLLAAVFKRRSGGARAAFCLTHLWGSRLRGRRSWLGPPFQVRNFRVSRGFGIAKGGARSRGRLWDATGSSAPRSCRRGQKVWGGYAEVLCERCCEPQSGPKSCKNKDFWPPATARLAV